METRNAFDSDINLSQNSSSNERNNLIQALFQDSPMALFCFRMDGLNQMSFPLVNDEFLKLMPNVIGEDNLVKTKDIFATVHPDNVYEFITKINEAYQQVATFNMIVKTFDQYGDVKFRKILAIPF